MALGKRYGLTPERTFEAQHSELSWVRLPSLLGHVNQYPFPEGQPTEPWVLMSFPTWEWFCEHQDLHLVGGETLGLNWPIQDDQRTRATVISGERQELPASLAYCVCF